MKKVNWAVLGTANIAKTEVIPGMKLSNHAQLYAIAGRKPEKLAAFQALFDFEKVYTNYDDVLNDPLVEAVYIPLSNDLHKEWVIKAARKKKHILCEKPLVGKASEIKELTKICQEEGVLLMEAFAYLHSPIIKDLIKRVNEGVIGEIKLIETAFHIPKQEDADIRSRKETLGGSQYDVGCYNISLILKLINQMPTTTVTATSVMTAAGIDAYTHAVLTFENGILATSSCGMILGDITVDRIDRCLIQGTMGHITTAIPYNGTGRLSYEIVTPNETQTISMEVPNNYALEIDQFSQCIRGEAKPLVTNAFSYQVATVQDQILDKIGYNKN